MDKLQQLHVRPKARRRPARARRTTCATRAPGADGPAQGRQTATASTSAASGSTTASTPKMDIVTVKAMSDAYFRILELQPQMKEVFRLGNHLVWVTPSGTALVIDVNDGKEKPSRRRDQEALRSPGSNIAQGRRRRFPLMHGHAGRTSSCRRVSLFQAQDRRETEQCVEEEQDSVVGMTAAQEDENCVVEDKSGRRGNNLGGQEGTAYFSTVTVTRIFLSTIETYR